MLLKHGARINYKDRSCQTALHKAIQNRHGSVVDLLLSKGANVNIRSVESFPENFYSTPLELAVKNSDLRLVQKLLKHKANPHIFGKHGYQPLHLATEQGNIAIMKELLKFGADIDQGIHFGVILSTPLHISVRERNLQVLKFLIKNGAKINKQDGHKETALHSACSYGYLEGVVELLKHNPEVNTVNDDCAMSPLHIAAYSGHLEIVQELLKHNANIDLGDVDNNTALHLATEKCCIEIVKTLLENGCNTSIKAYTHCTDEFFTALEVALDENSINIVKMITFHEN